MDPKQQMALAAAFAIAFVMLLFPPHYAEMIRPDMENLSAFYGWSVLGYGPGPQAVCSTAFGTEQQVCELHIDWSRLTVQFLALACLTGIFLIMSGEDDA